MPINTDNLDIGPKPEPIPEPLYQKYVASDAETTDPFRKAWREIEIKLEPLPANPFRYKVQDNVSKASGSALEAIAALTRALEAGGYNAFPTELVQGAGLKIESLDATMEHVTFDSKHIKLAKKIPKDSIFKNFSYDIRWDLKYDYPIEAKNIIPIVTDDALVDDRVVVTGGTPLTLEAIQKAAKQMLEASFQPDPPIILSPAQYATYQELMVDSAVRERAMWFPPSYMNPKCTKCNKQTQYCSCGLSDVADIVLDTEETPDLALAEAKCKAQKLADDIDFKMVKSFSERVDAGKKFLIAEAREGGCYMCAHPKKPSYAHKTHRMRFCLDCCALLGD